MTKIENYDINALITPDVIDDIIEGTVKQSSAMQMFRKLPNGTSNQMQMKVLDGLPVAYWVGSSNNGRKNLTKMAWDKKYINYAELAVIIPIKEDLFDDTTGINLWDTVKPRLVEAFGKKFDEAVFVGVDKPEGFRADLLTSIAGAGAVVAAPTSARTLYEAINDAMVKVEESGYNPTGIAGGVDVKGKFRMMLDNNGQPIKGTEIDSMPKAYIDNGAWNKALAQMIVGDFTQAVYSIRQDITFKILTESVIQDPATGSILYNLAQEDMVALRAVMRIGWEIPNPINALAPDESVRFPFAAIAPSGSTLGTTTYKVTFTVKDDADTPAAISGAKVTCGGLVKNTNAQGKAEFELQNGEYDYIVRKAGKKVETGSVEVSGATAAVAVTLVEQ